MHYMNKGTTLRSVLLMLGIIAAFTPSCFTQQPAEGIVEPVVMRDDKPRNSLESDILAYINRYRQSKGLNELVTASPIAVQAEKHSADMASKKVPFSHDGFESRVGVISKQLGAVKKSAENVAYGKIGAKEVVDIWLKSAGHRKNIEGNYQFTGIGIATAKDGTLFFTQIFVAK
jgi:uncharacterized protein YkwD